VVPVMRWIKSIHLKELNKTLFALSGRYMID
jgi:hypothetical protein